MRETVCEMKAEAITTVQYDQPLVSVLMTAYNREEFIAEAIVSVLASTYNNFELIIVDDCSTDSTVTIAKSYEAKDGRVKVIVNEKNLRQFFNRNYAASLAKGEFIFFADSDDTIMPDGIERLINTMSQFPSSSFGMYWYKAPDVEAFVMESTQAIHDHFFKNPILVIGPGGTIMRRSFFLDIKGYTDKYDAAGDMYFNLKACCYSPLVRIPFDFLNYRRHENQAINTPFEYLYNSYRYLKDALVEIPLPLSASELVWIRKKNNRRFLVNFCAYLIKTKNLGQAKKLLQKSGFKFKDALEGIFH